MESLTARAALSRIEEARTVLRFGATDLAAAGWLFDFGMDKAARLKVKSACLFIEAAIYDGLLPSPSTPTQAGELEGSRLTG